MHQGLHLNNIETIESHHCKRHMQSASFFSVLVQVSLRDILEGPSCKSNHISQHGNEQRIPGRPCG